MQRYAIHTSDQPNESTRKPARRRGFMSFELVMTLPVFGLVLMGLFEFSLLFFARGDLVEAARVGARKAALPGVTDADVEAEVRRVLPRHLENTMQVSVTPALHAGEVVTVQVWADMSSAAPDLLWPIGITLQDQQLYAAAHMIRE